MIKIYIGEDLIQPSGKFINHEEISHIVETALDSCLYPSLDNEHLDYIIDQTENFINMV